MRRLLAITAGLAFALSVPAQAANESATAQVRAAFVERAGVDLTTTLILPAVTTATTGVATGTRGTAGVAGRSGRSARGGVARSVSASNARLTIRGQTGEAMSMAVPESFKVVRSGGSETLTVKTSTNAEYGVDNGVLLSGADGAMSVDVGGSVSPEADAPPGPYEGLLVLVVQYN